MMADQIVKDLEYYLNAVYKDIQYPNDRIFNIILQGFRTFAFEYDIMLINHDKMIEENAELKNKYQKLVNEYQQLMNEINSEELNKMF